VRDRAAQKKIMACCVNVRAAAHRHDIDTSKGHARRISEELRPPSVSRPDRTVAKDTP
jgi:hypothetical protein